MLRGDRDAAVEVLGETDRDPGRRRGPEEAHRRIEEAEETGRTYGYCDGFNDGTEATADQEAGFRDLYCRIAEIVE